MGKRLSLGIVMLLVVASFASGQDTALPDGSSYRWVEIAGGLTRPLFLTHTGDGSGRRFIVGQNGQIWVMDGDSLLEQPFLDVSDLVSRDASERGLLGLAFHPDYEQNGQFFINYTDSQGDTVVARYTVSSDNPDAAAPASAQTLLRIEQPYANHNGGHIAFGPDGYLYIGMGDGGSAGDPLENGQNPQALLGKMLRIDVNAAGDEGKAYSIPPDNPYVNNPSLAPEVWALGLRNPWRFSFDRETGDLYIADVGQNQYEEVNFQPADSDGGENYGWNLMEGQHPYAGNTTPDGLVSPFFEAHHSDGHCSITGGYVYRGEALPDLRGLYFAGDYCSGVVWVSSRDTSGVWQSSVFMQTGLTISSFGEDEAGELYLVHHGGSVHRLERTDS